MLGGMKLSNAQQELLKTYQSELEGLALNEEDALALIGSLQCVAESILNKMYRLNEKEI
jgi:hypothetical protein